jgi:chitodextrinase
MRRTTPRHRRTRRLTTLTLVAGVLFALTPQLAAAAPTPPTNVAGIAGTGGVSLMWTPSTSMTASGYWIYRNGAIVGSVSSPTAGAYLDTTVTSATTYTYHLVSIDWYGATSTPSNAVTVKTAGAADTAVPSTPSGLSASPGNTTVVLSWLSATDNVGVTGYRVYRNGVLVGSPAGTSFGDTGLTNGTSYAYTVKAADAAGNLSAASGSATVAPFAPADTTAPAAPANLAAAAGNAQVALTWSAASDNVGVSGYRVYRNGTLVGSPAGTSFTDTGLANGTSYSYAVKAIDASGNLSASSAGASAVPFAAPPPTTPTPTSGGAACTKVASAQGTSAFQSLVSALAPGDVLCLHAGSYGARGTRITLGANGTSARPITIRNYPGEIRPALLGMFTVTGDYVVLDRVHFDGPTGNVGNSATASGEDIDVWLNGANGSTISRSEIEGSLWHAGVFASGSTGIRIMDDWIHDNGNPADAAQLNSSHGIYMSSGSGWIMSNLIEHNLAFGVHLYDGTGGPHDVLVSQNTIVDNGRAGVILANDTRNTLVVDNIIAWNASLAIYGWNLTNTTNSASNNVEYGNAAGNDQNYLGAGGIAFGSEILADPRFVAPVAGATGGDYRLQSSSPAVNRGRSAYSNADDVNGVVRPLGGAPDIGAYESF